MGEYDAGYENYIDGLHREIIDYQIEVEQVKGDNAKLVMKLNAEHIVRQNVERENAKLREQIHWLKKGDILHVLTDQEFAEQQKHEREMQASIKALDDENAKLRTLVRDMYKAFVHGSCYRWCEFKEPCNYITDGKCQWYDRMRELGVDV